MSRQKSIYEYISDNLGSSGRLASDFSLPDAYLSEARRQWAPGALDRSLLNNGFSAASEKEIDELVALIEEVDISGAENFIKNKSVLLLMDSLSERIFSGKTAIKPVLLMLMAKSWLLEGRETELVKLGMVLISLLNTGNDKAIQNCVMTLGKYKEFMFFALAAISNWEVSTKDFTVGNSLIFELAKQADGWGKSQALRYLKPDTPEISNWIRENNGAHSVAARERADSSEAKDLFTYEIINGEAIITKYLGGDSFSEVVIPDEFEGCPVTEIGVEAFMDDRYMNSLVDIACGDQPRDYSIITKITIPDTVRIINEDAFSGLARVNEVKLPSFLEIINDGAFEWWASWGIMYIPDGVKKIGDYSFGNPLFSDIYLPPSVVEIGEAAFGESTGVGPANEKIRLHLSPKAPPEQMSGYPWDYGYGRQFIILYDYEMYNGR